MPSASNTDQGLSYWLFAAGLPLVCILVFVGIVAARSRRRTGSSAPLKWLAPLILLAGCFILGQAFFERLETRKQDQISTGFLLLLTVSCWALMLRTASRQSQGGALLLDLGRPNQASSRRTAIIVFILISVALIVQSAIGWVAAGLHSLYGFVRTLAWTTAVVFWFVILRSRALIRERGVVANGEFVEWGRIIGYQWIGERQEQLLLRVRRRIPILGSRAGYAGILVSPDDKSAVSLLLAKHVPEIKETSADC